MGPRTGILSPGLAKSELGGLSHAAIPWLFIGLWGLKLESGVRKDQPLTNLAIVLSPFSKPLSLGFKFPYFYWFAVSTYLVRWNLLKAMSIEQWVYVLESM